MKNGKMSIKKFRLPITIILTVLIISIRISGISGYIFQSIYADDFASIHYMSFMTISNGVSVFSVLVIAVSVILDIMPLIGLFVSRNRLQFLCFVIGPYLASLIVLCVTIFYNYNIFVYIVRVDLFPLLLSIVLTVVLCFVKYEKSNQKHIVIGIVILLVILIVPCCLSIVSFEAERDKYEGFSEEKIVAGNIVFDPNSEVRNKIISQEATYEYKGQSYSFDNVDIIAKTKDRFLYCTFYKKGNSVISVIKTINEDMKNQNVLLEVEKRIVIGDYTYFRNNYGFVFDNCFYYIFDNEDKLYNKDDIFMYDIINDILQISKQDISFIEENAFITWTGLVYKIGEKYYKYAYELAKGELVNDKLSMSKFIDSSYRSYVTNICFDEDVYLMIKTTSREHFVIVRINHAEGKYEYIGTIKMDENTSASEYIRNEASNSSPYYYCPDYYFIIEG